MTISQSQVKQIKELLNKGYSGNKISKIIHKKKQDTLNTIRKIKNVPKNSNKITNPKGQNGKKPINPESKKFIEQLYKSGYPEYFIIKLVNDTHKETSKYKIRKYLKLYKSNNPDAITSHKGNMKFYKSTGKYKQHLDAKYYCETAKHFQVKYNNRFKTGSPKIEYESEQ